jgi:hypothetical protein
MGPGSRSFARNAAFFAALLATSLALGGALAHAFELPNKMALGRADYFVVQTIYSGWDRLAYVLAVVLIGMFAVIFLYRAEPRVLGPACLALAGLVGAQVVFWVWTFPTNQATRNWTQQPENWEALRAQWEYSHLAGAGFQTLAMIALIIAVLSRDPSRRDL